MNALALTLCFLAQQPGLVEELLKQPAPIADWRETVNEQRARILPSLRAVPNGEPADEAPLDSLRSCWDVPHGAEVSSANGVPADRGKGPAGTVPNRTTG